MYVSQSPSVCYLLQQMPPTICDSICAALMILLIISGLGINSAQPLMYGGGDDTPATAPVAAAAGVTTTPAVSLHTRSCKTCFMAKMPHQLYLLLIYKFPMASYIIYSAISTLQCCTVLSTIFACERPPNADVRAAATAAETCNSNNIIITNHELRHYCSLIYH